MRSYTNKKSYVSIAIRIFLVLLTLCCLYALAIEWMFNRLKSSQPVLTEYWSHRGVNNDSLPENSIPAFERVLKYGLTGIETDVFWDEAGKRFLITHDTPDFSQKNVLLLDDVVGRFKDSISYWVDFKNLSVSNQPEVDTALTALVLKHHLQGKLFVESANYRPLRKFNSAVIKKLYWAQFGRNFPVKQIKLLYLKTIILCSSFDGYTCGYGLYDEAYQKEFNGLPVYLFHADAASIIRDKEKATSIKVHLADGDYLKSLQK